MVVLLPKSWLLYVILCNSERFQQFVAAPNLAHLLLTCSFCHGKGTMTEISPCIAGTFLFGIFAKLPVKFISSLSNFRGVIDNFSGHFFDRKGNLT